MDGLARQLDAFMDGLLERTDARTAKVLREAATALEAAGVLNNALREGDFAPDFALPDQNGRVVTLHELLSKGPVVLTFFRGGWCPFCTLALRALEAIRPALRKQKAEVVAISPQSAISAQETADRNGLAYPILTDHGNVVARRYGLVWELGPEMRAIYEKFGHPLPQINGAKDWTLPIPAGFVVAQDGRITTAHLDTRVTRRLEPAVALEAVRLLERA